MNAPRVHLACFNRVIHSVVFLVVVDSTLGASAAATSFLDAVRTSGEEQIDCFSGLFRDRRSWLWPVQAKGRISCLKQGE